MLIIHTENIHLLRLGKQEVNEVRIMSIKEINYMPTYTNFFDDKTHNIFDEDDYIEELKKSITLFRTFDKALDTFINEHGYTGDIDDADEKVRFIADKFKSSNIPIPRNIKKWYTEHKTIERKTAFQLCFAFHLQTDEVNDFLRRICLSRGFDCHAVDEIIYYFAFKHALQYQDTQDILSQVTRINSTQIPKDEVIYTDLIISEIDEIETVEELILYLNENIDKFAYNNATAYEAIQVIWKSISKEDGLAIREKKLLYMTFDKEEACVEQNEAHKDKKRKERNRMDDSIWEIYLQILGLSGNYVAEFYKDRSLKTILKDNVLLHPLAEASFPDRDGLNKILIGTHVSYERVRKLLILLVFYKFWGNKALQNHNYKAGYGDNERCVSVIDNHLVDAGYPMLYPGNPYDFIILMSANAEYPMLIFREYMRELFFAKLESNEL